MPPSLIDEKLPFVPDKPLETILDAFPYTYTDIHCTISKMNGYPGTKSLHWKCMINGNKERCVRR